MKASKIFQLLAPKTDEITPATAMAMANDKKCVISVICVNNLHNLLFRNVGLVINIAGHLVQLFGPTSWREYGLHLLLVTLVGRHLNKFASSLQVEGT